KFHAEYQEYETFIDIRTLEIIRGEIPARAKLLVTEWANAHQNELIKDWEKAQKPEPLNKIEPLNKMIKITKIEFPGNHLLKLFFDDDSEKTVDFGRYINESSLTKPLKD